MGRRLLKVMGMGAAALIAGWAYALFYRRTGLGVPCPIHAVTGLNCPGCGVTRMLESLLRLDVEGAFQHNAVLLCILPLLAAMLAEHWARYVRTGTRRPGILERMLSWPLVGVLLIWGVARNIAGI